ncbi:MAG TPA: DNA primase [Burkholderiales bacterium]|nr:DNA primase [Burkholderiales bacterium]
MIPDSFKQDLLNRLDIVDVVGRYVQLKKAGANFSGLCPFHNEKTPSFTVSPAKQFYHCFGCQKHGNAIGFLMDYGSMGYVDAVKELAASVGMQVPAWQPRTPEEAKQKERETDLFALMQKAMEFYRGELKRAPRAIEYLKGRGLSGEVAARFGLGYAADDWQGLKRCFADYDDAALVECGLVIEGEGKRYDRFRDRVMFPIFNRRDLVVGFGGRVLGEGEPKYLNSPETPLFQKGREIYGLGHAREAMHRTGSAVMVEGYMDVVALAQHGVENAVATLGTATTPAHVSALLRLVDDLVFCFDGDAAGRKAAWRALEVAVPLVPDQKAVRFLFLPEGEDPDSFVRANGREAFARLLGGAEPLSSFLLGELRERSDLDSAEGRARFLSAVKPYVLQLTAPALRIQIMNEVAEAARVSEQDLRGLFGAPSGSAEPRRAPARHHSGAPASPEWHLLVSLLSDLEMIQHVDPALLSPELPETAALLAVRRVVLEAGEPPSFAVLIEKLEDDPHLEHVLRAERQSSERGFDQDNARQEFRDALAKLDLVRRKRELDEILKQGLGSTEERMKYQEKLTSYKRLQGALPERDATGRPS